MRFDLHDLINIIVVLVVFLGPALAAIIKAAGGAKRPPARPMPPPRRPGTAPPWSEPGEDEEGSVLRRLQEELFGGPVVRERPVPPPVVRPAPAGPRAAPAPPDSEEGRKWTPRPRITIEDLLREIEAKRRKAQARPRIQQRLLVTTTASPIETSRGSVAGPSRARRLLFPTGERETLRRYILAKEILGRPPGFGEGTPAR